MSGRDDDVAPNEHPALAAQNRRLENSRALLALYNASMFPRKVAPVQPAPALRAFEGAVPGGSARRQLDPLGLERTRHDVPPNQTLQEWLAPETATIKAAFARHGIDRADADYRETLVVPNSVAGAPDLVVRVQNIVHTNYCSADPALRDLDSDDESCQGQSSQRRHPAVPLSSDDGSDCAFAPVGGYRKHERVDDHDSFDSDGGGVEDYDDGDDVMTDVDLGLDSDDSGYDYGGEDEEEIVARLTGEPGARRTFFKPTDDTLRHPISHRTTMLFSLRQAQRRLLGIGYHKNRVGTAIGLRYARPWSGSQLAFPKGRVLGTGTHNRKVDRVQLIHGLCAYLRKAGAHGIGLKVRTSQNFVAKCQLPTPTGLCLGRICQQLKDKAKPTKKFTGIVVKWAPATLLLFEYGSMICIGTSSIAQLQHAVATVAPIVMANFRTPENEAQEQEMMRAGVLKDFTPNQLRPRLADWDAEASKRRRRNNEARRRPKVRFMGGF
jgi:hypothetical protein